MYLPSAQKPGAALQGHTAGINTAICHTAQVTRLQSM